METDNHNDEIQSLIMDRLDLIAEEAKRCLDCSLHSSKKKSVPGHYTIDALRHPVKVMLVGGSPGMIDNETGNIFVGKDGEELNKLLDIIEMRRKDVFIFNTVMCRTPKNRLPTHEEMFICAYYLYRQIGLIQPDLIIAMGASAIYTLIQNKKTNFTPSKKHKIMKVNEARHRVYDFVCPSIDGIPEWKCKAIATYHPNKMLIDGEARIETYKDFIMIKKYIDTIRKKKMRS